VRSTSGVAVLRCAAGIGLGYLLGTFPSSDVVVRLARSDIDLRQQGSGNPGAANALQLLGPRWGGAVLAADVGKGALACAAGRLVAGDIGAHLGGTAAVIGHCYPVWSEFKGGGKGVATSAGQCLATFPAYFPIDLAVAFGTARWRRGAWVTSAAASATWVIGSWWWWRRGWPNLWGPEPNGALMVGALLSGTAIMSRFWQTRNRASAGWFPCRPEGKRSGS
jgi:acyl phosphate:glycerol-3-phosphate acyltransferase